MMIYISDITSEFKHLYREKNNDMFDAYQLFAHETVTW
jgi:hypothetical protein